MGNGLIKAYLREFGSKYLGEEIFEEYPEAKIIPGYIRQHFAKAETVLDLGFGAGLWFWASFLPSLKRLDGFDGEPDALEEADRVFTCEEVPAGYLLAHERLGEGFTLADLRRLKEKRGRLVIEDYRRPWPPAIMQTRYDLLTEHGGGMGDMQSEDEFIGVFKKAAQVLNPGGSMLFVNFLFKERSALAERLGKGPLTQLPLGPELYRRAAEQAEMSVADFHAIDNPPEMPRVRTFIYGYAQKPPHVP